MSALNITLKRVYLPPASEDGLRILIERLWPRGLTKDKAAIEHWAKDIAPSPELRKWYGHEPDRWEEFQQRYRIELVGNLSEVKALENLCANEKVTFVFAAKDEARNSAMVLREYLVERT